MAVGHRAFKPQAPSISLKPASFRCASHPWLKHRMGTVEQGGQRGWHLQKLLCLPGPVEQERRKGPDLCSPPGNGLGSGPPDLCFGVHSGSGPLPQTCLQSLLGPPWVFAVILSSCGPGSRQARNWRLFPTC
jgi:hypothetical protein